MWLTYQHLIANSPSRPTTAISLTRISRPITSRHVTTPLRFHSTLNTTPFSCTLYPNNFSIPKAYSSNGKGSDDDDDAFLSIAEFLCIFSAAVVTISYAVTCTFPVPKSTVLRVVGSHVAFSWGMVVLIGGLAIGAWIRRRRRRRWPRSGGEEMDLVMRVEKLEEDLSNSATIIRVLSRQLEKLGIRFRVTRKSLKQPIAETLALAQKNSEATRALAVQEDILEKELGEIQKVLLAMQEQQQKQLELILAIGKTGRLWDTKQEPNKEQEMIHSSDLSQEVKKLDINKTQASGAIMGTNNDRP